MKPFVASKVLVFSIALPLALAGQKPDSRGQRIPVPVEGAQIFRTYCAVCHGPEGRGGGPAAAALRHAPPDLTLIARRAGGRFPRERIKAIIAGDEQAVTAHGSREMPIWGPVFHQVERDQDWGEVRLDNVTRFVESVQQK